MGKNADISWLHPSGGLPGATWSPWHGCSRVHTGCKNCWAEMMNHRWGHDNWGTGKPRRVTAASGWKQPLAWARAAAKAGQRMLVSPLDCDPLDAEVYERDEGTSPGVNYWAGRQSFDRFMQTIRETTTPGTGWDDGDREDPREVGYPSGPPPASGGLTWLLLTKRPENWRWIPEDVRPFCWLLYSASDQPSLDAGMLHLLAAEGFAGLGLSLEPLVRPVRLFHIARREPFWSKLRWVVCGGESGRNARPCEVAWIRDIVRQCREAGVSPYVKQMGARSYQENPDTCIVPHEAALLARDALVGTFAIPGAVLRRRDPAGADPSEWPEDLRVQEFPEGLR